ncbi:MAG: molybdopterin molybdotransferase MoeA [Pelomonas sp.]|nr:molybdopterin molybdotransferase MoeA [Roseateles sp.]
MSELLSFEAALERLLGAVAPLGRVETRPTAACLGRVLAADLVSTLDVPPLDNSAMDGYALRFADLDAGQALPVSQRVPAGSLPQPLAAGTCARIFTGAPVPVGADIVVMQEHCEVDDAGVRVSVAPRPGQHVRRRGEDVRAGSTVLAAGHRLDAASLGLAATVGAAQLDVAQPLRVALFSTGDELQMPGEPLKPGAIYNSNRYTLRALLEGLGCAVVDLGIVPDRLDATRAALRDAAARADVIVTSGGVSVGEEDHLRPAVEAEGRLELWRVAIKPGKPLAFGRVGDACFVGLPGNPVSSLITFVMLVRPLLLRLLGATKLAPTRYALRADFAWPRPDARREFLRVRLNEAGGVELFANQGSGVLTSAVWGDGLVDNPPHQAIAPGDTVGYLPLRELMA